MSWERDPLWAKAKLFLQRTIDLPRENPEFGLWCSFGLELLARSALASISPTLLADPDNEQKHLLYALNRGAENNPKSLAANRVFALCKRLFPAFTQDDFNASLALTNRRNEELHSGADAFGEYKPTQWLGGYYRACRALADSMGESLVTLFGKEEAEVAAEMLRTDQEGVMQRVKSAISAHRTVFMDKPEPERLALTVAAVDGGKKLSVQQHHRVTCPACECVATVRGTLFGKEQVTHDDGEIVVRQSVSPTAFSCGACGLELKGYAELEVGNLGGHYTRTTTYSPEEYYGLIDPEDIPPEMIQPHIDAYLREGRQEYDNE
jgi:hypothetical protein